MIRFKRGGPRDWLVFQSPPVARTARESASLSATAREE
jgi:hypothetical protein